MPNKVLRTIGSFNLPFTHTFDIPQEFAGAYEQVEVPAGSYPIEERLDQYGHTYVAITFPGTCIARGWHSSCQHKDETPNTPSEYHWWSEVYMLDWGIKYLERNTGGKATLT